MSPEGQAKINLILELKNRLKTGFQQAKDNVNRTVGDLKSKISELHTPFKQVDSGFSRLKMSGLNAFQSLKQEVPIVGRAIQLLKNPITMVAGALVGIGMMLSSSIKDAEAFSGNLRKLQMLNLDKPTADLGRLSNMVKNTAYIGGFDVNKTSTAFFDVQSVTGKYGNEVKKIVAKQGEFAMIMQADFNAWVAGTAKAMANYGFGADKLEEFNRAAFATVKTGVTTFDELSKVMSVYAGAASSAKQDFSAANKLFALFTVKVKNVDEAATLTKSLFNDLTKATTISAFHNIGIEMYDANHRFKQADTILLELSRKFQALGKNDSALINLKNQFAGSEGLISFIQSAMGSTQQLQDMINSFDASGLDMSKAMEIAQNDINYINEQLTNRINLLKTEIGALLLPVKNDWQQFKFDLLTTLSPLRAAQGAAGRGQKFIEGTFSAALAGPQTKETMAATLEELKKYQAILMKGPEEIKKYDKKFIDGLSSKFSGALLGSQLPMLSKINQEGYIKGALQELSMTAIRLVGGAAAKPLTDLNPWAAGEEPEEPGKGKGDGKPLGSESVKEITGSARQVKNLTVNIDSFVKNMDISNEHIQEMDNRQLEDYFSDILTRVVRNLETSYQ